MTNKEIIGIVLMASLLAGIWFWRGHEIDDILQNGKKTTAVITNVGGKNITVSFQADGTFHQDVLTRPYYNLYEGETYSLLYNPKDLKLTVMLFWQPIFDKKDYAIINPSEIHETLEGSTLEFEYIVYNRTYKRFQDIIPTKKYVYNSRIKVFYKIADPKIAYIQY